MRGELVAEAIGNLYLRISKKIIGGDFYGVRGSAIKIAGAYTKYVRTIFRAMTKQSGKSAPRKVWGCL